MTRQRTSALGSVAKRSNAGTAARRPRRHDSRIAWLTTGDTGWPGAPRSSSCWIARAPESPPMRARAVTAWISGSPCWSGAAARARVTSGPVARAWWSSPRPNAAAARTVELESASAATSTSTAAGSPTRPAASAAWRRTAGLGSWSASPSNAASKRRASAAASRRASSPTSASSACCAGARRGAPSPIRRRKAALQAHRVRHHLQTLTHVLRNAGGIALAIERDERRLAGGEQLAGRGALDRVAEGDAAGREVAHPAAHAHEIVVERRPAKAQARLGHRQEDARFLHRAIRVAGDAQVFGARPIEPDEIVRVVHHAHLVGFGIVDAQLDDGLGRRLGAGAHSP